MDSNIKEISDMADEYLKHHTEMTEYEALRIAVETKRNEILKKAFVVSESDSHPSALESIAMGLRNLS